MNAHVRRQLLFAIVGAVAVLAIIVLLVRTTPSGAPYGGPSVTGMQNAAVNGAAIAVEPLAPDLTIRQLETMPSSPAVGAPMLVTFRVINRGRFPANATTLGVESPGTSTVAVGPDDSCGASFALAPTESCRVSRVFTFAAAGDYRLVFTVDPADAVVESSESNNVRGVPVVVRANAVPASVSEK